jgi:uncharacterized protein (DUF3820 family)
MNQSEVLLELVKFKMPFGRYKGTVLANLPVSYLEWFQRKGFPDGKLGMMLATIYEIKSNGLEYLLEPLRKL